MKAQLTHIAHGMRVWLDVDNMRSKAGTSATDKKSFQALMDKVHLSARLSPATQ